MWAKTPQYSRKDSRHSTALRETQARDSKRARPRGSPLPARSAARRDSRVPRVQLAMHRHTLAMTPLLVWYQRA